MSTENALRAPILRPPGGGPRRRRVERGENPGGERRRAPALDELDQGVQIEPPVARDHLGEPAGKPGRTELIAAPADDAVGDPRAGKA